MKATYALSPAKIHTKALKPAPIATARTTSLGKNPKKGGIPLRDKNTQAIRRHSKDLKPSIWLTLVTPSPQSERFAPSVTTE